MSDKDQTGLPRPARHINPKSEDGLSRSAQALRANLLKRKAQVRARAAGDSGSAAPNAPAAEGPESEKPE